MASAPPSPPEAGDDLEPREGEDIISAALKVLHTADPHLKAARTDRIVALWQAGRIGLPQPGVRRPPPPDRPARETTKVCFAGPGLRWRSNECAVWAGWVGGSHGLLDSQAPLHTPLSTHSLPGHLKSPLLPPPPLLHMQVKLVPVKYAPKRGKGGSLASRQAILHSLVHIENAAVDLAW